MSAEKPKKEEAAPEYVPVDFTQLKVGTLIDRPLYAKMNARGKFLLMARALHPLEEKVFNHFREFGGVYSQMPALEERYPELTATCHRVREILNDTASAPFERGAELKKATQWLADLVLRKNGDSFVAVFFCSKLFGSPKPETIKYVSDLSVDLHERALKIASVFGVIMLWLGAAEEQIQELIPAIFCEEISLYREDSPNLRQIALSGEKYKAQDSDRAFTAGLLEKGEIPGVSQLGVRAVRFVSQRGRLLRFGEELAEAVEVARWICDNARASPSIVWESRVARKLTKSIGFDVSGKAKKKTEAQKGAKAA